LQHKTISVETAAAAFPAVVEDASVGSDHQQYELPGSAFVNYRQIPAIAESLQADWLHINDGKRPSDCFVEVRGLIETHMHPCFLGPKLRVGLQGAVGTLLHRFSTVLQCVPLCFTRLRPAGTHAAVVGESPYVHFLADFTAIGFAPVAGHHLIGRASKRQTGLGINIQILNTFNAFARTKYLPAELSFDRSKGAWVHGDNADSVALGDPVWVEVGKSGLASSTPPSLDATIKWPPWVALKTGDVSRKRARSPEPEVATGAAAASSSSSKRCEEYKSQKERKQGRENTPMREDLEERDEIKKDRKEKHGREKLGNREREKRPKGEDLEEGDNTTKKERKEKKEKDTLQESDQNDSKRDKHKTKKKESAEEKDGKDKNDKKEKKEKKARLHEENGTC